MLRPRFRVPLRSALTLVAALAVAACGEKGGSGAARGDTTQVARGGSGKTVAVVLPVRDAFWQQFEAGLKEAAQRGDYKLRVESADADTAKQRAAIERAVNDGADALLLAPLDGPGAAPGVRAAVAAKIPVFTVGVEIPGAPIIAHVASDDAAGGAVAATYISTFLKNGAQVGVIGVPGSPSGNARDAAFRSALASTKTISIVPTVGGGGTRETARVATDTLLKAHPEIDALFVTSEAMTPGAIDAVRARGRQELVVVGYGLPPETKQEIAQESPLKAVVLEAPRELGMRALQVVAEHLSNEGVPSRLAVGVRLMTIGNVGAAKP